MSIRVRDATLEGPCQGQPSLLKLNRATQILQIPAAEKSVVASEAKEEAEKVIEVKVPSEAPPAKPVEPAKQARPAKECCPF